MVRDGETGYLARLRNVEDLSYGLRTILEAGDRGEEMADGCRRTIEAGYTLELEIQRFSSFYDEIVREHRKADGSWIQPSTKS